MQRAAFVFIIRRTAIASAFVVSSLASLPATAAPLEINSGNSFGLWADAEADGRGIVVFMLSDFTLTSIGLHAPLPALSFDVQVYASTNGSDTGALLASETAALGGKGYQWWDIPINFNLTAGNYYVLHFRPTVPAYANWAGFALIYFLDETLPVDIGAFRLVQGEQGHTPPLLFDQYLHPDLRVNGPDEVIPEPATLLLLGTGLGALARRTRRRA